jgi:T-complex protein 1 subunit eta
VLNEMKELEFSIDFEDESLVKDIISIPFHSKLLYHDREFFTNLIYESSKLVKNFNSKSIHILSIPGGSLSESILIDGIVFPQTFSYAGYEQQSKLIKKPKILLLNHEVRFKFFKIRLN